MQNIMLLGWVDSKEREREELSNFLSLFLFFVTSEIITLHSQLSNIQTKKPNSANHGTEEKNMDGKADIHICWQERYLQFFIPEEATSPSSLSNYQEAKAHVVKTSVRPEEAS